VLEDYKLCRKDSRLKLANIQWSEKVLIAQVNHLIISMQIAEEAWPGFAISFYRLPFLAVFRNDNMPI
jgi:hypothetical protein